MDDLDEYLDTHRTLSENIRNGLVSISQEEKQLLVLRNQLGKIKKIRDEQMKKDQLITSLKEQIAIYEHERATANRQNTELQEIMSERIATLEKYLYEKEHLEIKYTETTNSLEMITTERNQFQEQLMKERERTEKYKTKYEKACLEMQSLSLELNREREIAEQVQIVLENIRSETEIKENTISDLKTRHLLMETELQEKLSQANQTIEDLMVKLRLYEESMKMSEKTQDNHWHSLQTLQKDLFDMKNEAEKWERKFYEIDARYHVLHQQAETIKSAHYVEDIHTLREEKIVLTRRVQLRDSEIEAIRTVVNYASDVLKSVSSQSAILLGDHHEEIEKLHEAVNRIFTIRNQVIECGFDSLNEVNRMLKYLSLFFHKYLTVIDANHHKQQLATSFNNSLLSNSSNHGGGGSGGGGGGGVTEQSFQQQSLLNQSLLSHGTASSVNRYQLKSSHTTNTHNTDHITIRSRLQQEHQQDQQRLQEQRQFAGTSQSNTITPTKHQATNTSDPPSVSSSISAESPARSIFKKYNELFTT